ncbi:MAG TPA: hypothetical protein PLS25_06420 [Methanoregulaceae archaeon]|nr:hypothetical protein [Methanoregulaceae archaeon]
MKVIEMNADELSSSLLRTIQGMDEFPHYQGILQDVARERIFHVIRNVYERLGNWLNKNKPKNTLFAYYSDLGAQRMREGIPLEELITLFLLIKREIWHLFREELNSNMDIKRLMEVDFYVNHFFDRITIALISGYQEELGKKAIQRVVRTHPVAVNGPNRR